MAEIAARKSSSAIETAKEAARAGVAAIDTAKDAARTSLADAKAWGSQKMGLPQERTSAEHAAATKLQNAQRSKLARQATMAKRDEMKEVRSSLRKVLGTEGKEVMDLFVEPDIDMIIKCSFSGGSSSKAGSYVVAGPPARLVTLRRAFGLSTSAALPSGVVSPLSEVTLPDSVRLVVGIPLACTHFACVYPLKEFKTLDLCVDINLSEEAWCFALILGGFAYFDSAGELLTINSITIVPSLSVLKFVGAYPGRQLASLRMMQDGRFAAVAFEGLRDVGFRRFGWVHPGERPGGLSVSPDAECLHGGLLYEMADGRLAFFNLVGDLATVSHEKLDFDGTFARAFVSMRRIFVESVDAHMKKELTKKMRATLVHELSMLLISLALYYGIACAVLCQKEVMDWTVIEAIYFATVTASTVGYGDLTPSDSLGPRLFAVFLIFIGLLFIFARLTTTVDLLFEEYDQWARRHLRRLIPPSTQKDEDGREVIESKFVFYSKNMLPNIGLNIVLQLGSAGVFVAIERWDYGSALYHCIVTATTVGYGDESIDSPSGQAWAVVHILLSVSMLGFSLTSLEELRLERSKELKRVAALNQKLTKSLLERVELHSAALRPEIQRDAAGVTELEFVICMAVELGMVEVKQLQPFIAQFRALDMQGDGRVGMNDLNLLLALERNRAAHKSSRTLLSGMASSLSERESNTSHRRKSESHYSPTADGVRHTKGWGRVMGRQKSGNLQRDLKQVEATRASSRMNLRKGVTMSRIVATRGRVGIAPTDRYGVEDQGGGRNHFRATGQAVSVVVGGPLDQQMPGADEAP